MNISIKRAIRGVALVSAMALLTALGTTSAMADTATDSSDSATTAAQISDAVAATGTETADDNADIDISATDGTGVVNTPDGQLTMSTPSSGDGQTAPDGLTTVYDGSADDTSVALQPTDTGLRAAIAIDSASAPEDYSFQIGGDVASLVLNDDGSVTALSADGTPIAQAPTPWAMDADGNTVPTYYEVDGTTLTQVVEHQEGEYSYGIVADPWWNPFSWPWGKWVKKTASVVKSAVTKCAKGGTKAALALLIGTGTTNLMISKYSATEDLVTIEGKGYALVGVAVGGCLVEEIG